MRVYLDNCCFNRPYDDQTQEKIILETQAKLFIQNLALHHQIELAWSYILEFENNQNTETAKRKAIADWRARAVIQIPPNDKILETSKEIISTGVKEFDALHVACAIYAQCDYFITVDKRLLKFHSNKVNVCSPLEFVAHYEEV